MTFTSGIPTSGQSLGATRDDIRNNFTNYNNVVSQDHISPNSTGQGKHNKSTYVEQASDPVTIASEVAMYSKDLSGASTLYLRKESAGTVIQMSGQDPTIASSGSTFLPGGVILKWGTGTAGNGTVISFASAFPTACWGVTLTIIRSSVPTGVLIVQDGSLTTTSFTTLSSISGNVPIFYYAIGN